MLLLPYLALCYYNQPYWDDYGNAVLARNLGWPAAVAHLYTNWTGRYTAALWLTGLNPLSYGWEAGVGLFAFGLFVVTGGVQALALRTLTRGHLSWRASWAWSGAWLLGQLYTMPSVNSGFYWFASTVTYQIAAVLLVLVPVAGLRAGQARAAGVRGGWYALAVVAALGVAGSNELALVLLLWLLLVLTAATWRRAASGGRYRWLSLLLISGAAGAVALLAPGNFARMAFAGKAESAGIGHVVGRAVAYMGMFVTTPINLTTLALAPVLVSGLGYRMRRWRPAGLHCPLPLGLGVVALGLFACFLLLSRTWPGYPAVRSLNFLWFWLLTGWLLALWAALPTTPGAPGRRWLASLRVPALAYALLLAAGGNQRAAWREWLETAPAFKQQNEARSRAIQAAQAQGQRTVEVTGLQNLTPHYLLVLGDPLSEDASSELNRAVAGWFQVDSLRVQQRHIEGVEVNFH
ncbi:hypothetical protein GCM10022406_15980 [Hymenobacter algoricola]|uniref:Uncharacterized protein n=1 Tax=Hymenobacter algoricola TaxID=486267 RepID=A0ABP7MWM2_9BACT